MQGSEFHKLRDTHQHAKQPSRVLQVTFPLILDCYEFCSEEYKKELEGPREAYKQIEDRKAGLIKRKKAAERKAAEEREKAANEASRKRPLAQVSIGALSKMFWPVLGSDVPQLKPARKVRPTLAKWLDRSARQLACAFSPKHSQVWPVWEQCELAEEPFVDVVRPLLASKVHAVAQTLSKLCEEWRRFSLMDFLSVFLQAGFMPVKCRSSSAAQGRRRIPFS